MAVAPPRRRLGREDVLDAAEELVDRLGWDGLTMAELAGSLGVKAPSLYTHVRGLDDVKAEMQVRTMRQLADRMRSAAMGRSDDDAFRTLAGELHDFATAHPRRYDGMTRQAIDPVGLLGAANDASEALLAVLRSYGLPEALTFDAQLAAFAALHGAVALEISGFFGEDIDSQRVFELVLEGAIHAIAAAGAHPTRHRPGGTP